MGRKRANSREIIVNYNGELLQAQIRMDIMKHFIEEQKRQQERWQMPEVDGLQETEEDAGNS